jgi:Bacterial Ig-like domain (group 1)
MKRSTPIWGILVLSLGLSGCSRKSVSAAGPAPTAFGAVIVESSRGKQIGATGTTLLQPVVVQVNDEQGTAVPGAPVQMTGSSGTSFDPSTGITDSSGQFTTNVTLGSIAGRYQITAITLTKAQRKIDLKLEEIALGYQQEVGHQLDNKYCARPLPKAIL